MTTEEKLINTTSDTENLKNIINDARQKVVLNKEQINFLETRLSKLEHILNTREDGESAWLTELKNMPKEEVQKRMDKIYAWYESCQENAEESSDDLDAFITETYPDWPETSNEKLDAMEQSMVRVQRQACKKGADWQRQKDEHLIWKLSSANYEKGKEDMKQQMLKEFTDSSEDLNDFIEKRIKDVPIVMRSGFHQLCRTLVRDGANWESKRIKTKPEDIENYGKIVMSKWATSFCGNILFWFIKGVKEEMENKADDSEFHKRCMDCIDELLNDINVKIY